VRLTFSLLVVDTSRRAAAVDGSRCHDLSSFGVRERSLMARSARLLASALRVNSNDLATEQAQYDVRWNDF
jgi:hypothetical protein